MTDLSKNMFFFVEEGDCNVITESRVSGRVAQKTCKYFLPNTNFYLEDYC